jgi:predicted Fe-Mo cluster-binding NifX family protein
MEKAAIATQDGKSLWKDHFGQAPFYQICEFDGKQWIKGEKRANPFAATGKHARPEEIRQVLADCNIFAAREMGKKSRQALDSSGVITFLKDVDTVEDVIAFFPAPDAFPVRKNQG